MKKLFKVDLTHVLAPLSVAAVVLLILFRGNSTAQFTLVAVSVSVYLIVVLIHHWFDKSLTFEVMVEYILIAVLILIILQGILL